MTTERYIKLGRQTALISFLLVTVIFGLDFQISTLKLLSVLDYLTFFGLSVIFILLAGLINLGILISILLRANKDKDNRKKLLKTCGLMLLNIPVLLFFYLILEQYRYYLWEITGILYAPKVQLPPIFNQIFF